MPSIYIIIILQKFFSPLEGDISQTKCRPDLRLTPKVVGFYKLQDDVKFIVIGDP